MSTLRVNNITDTSGGSSSLSVPGAAKAWVNFNGTGVVAIRAQLNVSSITDNGTGDYTVNFTTAMTDANYAWLLTVDFSTSVARNINLGTDSSSQTTSSIRVYTYNITSGAADDYQAINLGIFR